jgi:hypothetical protein
MVGDAVFGLGEIAVLIVGFTFPVLMMFQAEQLARPVSAVPLVLLFGLILRDSWWRERVDPHA